MNAIFFNQTGDPQEVLAIGEFDRPSPGPGEILVKVHAASINPADILFIQGKYRIKPEFPQIAGLEAAGVIESVGAGVTLKPGSRVAFLWLKTWAEYVILPESEAVPLPLNFPADKAAQAVLNPFTAWGLLERVNLRSGEWLLLTAGNSGVARLLIQLARTNNIKVIATVRSESYTSDLVSLGAEVINIEKEDVEKKVMSITSGQGLHGALDPVGGHATTAVLRSLSFNGKFIGYGALSSEPFQVQNAQIVYKNSSLTGFGIRGYLASKSKEERSAIAAQLVPIIAKPDFQLEAGSHYPMTDIKKALADDQQRDHRKILLAF